MRRVKLTIAYDGTAYCGFQIQPNGITIQAVMEDALGQLLQAVSYTHLTLPTTPYV